MELNEKLARWAGFSQTVGESLEGIWTFPERSISSHTLPDFTSSLDACLKWLVPEIREIGYSVNLCISEYGVLAAIYDPVYYNERDKYNIALALCKAIEQLIDKETP